MRLRGESRSLPHLRLRLIKEHVRSAVSLRFLDDPQGLSCRLLNIISRVSEHNMVDERLSLMCSTSTAFIGDGLYSLLLATKRSHSDLDSKQSGTKTEK